jgi:dTMP kinase
MYLITVEGGDGSGKGVATKIIADICEEFSFTDVAITAEPRRDHPLGQLAVEAVRTGDAGPVREASMFAADRLDHSHAWIIPKLKEGLVVISERNVHSSLVYQGMVGNLGLEEVARLNSAACVPDLCVWVDCDPEMALNRISEEGLKLAISTRTDDTEYFETDEYQVKIRAGYTRLLGGQVPMPKPFDKGVVAGPIVNDGTKDQLKEKLKAALRDFINRKMLPLNVDSEVVDRHLLSAALQWQKQQRRLDVLDSSPGRFNEDWLGNVAPWRVVKEAHAIYLEARDNWDDDRRDVPQNPLLHPILSIVGTLSLIPGAEVVSLRRWLGPVRMVTYRHTQRMLRFFEKQSGWVRKHSPLLGRSGHSYELRADWQAYGRLGLAIWPLKEELATWRSENPEGGWKHSISAILGRNPSKELRTKVDACNKRLELLGSGIGDAASPTDFEEFRNWWRGG